MNEQEGIYIYDNDANLVYSSWGSGGPGVIHAPQVCNYKGSPHLCFYQGVQMIGWGHGHGVIMDSHYRVVKSIEPSGSYQASSDMHEFRLIDGDRALMTQYLRSVHDLCDYDLCDGLGYIQQGAFQEIDVETGEVIFEWHSLDHIALDESYVLPSSTEISGSGQEPTSPWDYFHINSIDKNDDGDYLISARHVSAVYKISGQDGHIIWRLNGAKSDFHLDNFGFSFQHDARWISDSKDESVISVFNNGGNGFNQTHPHSDGKIIHIDHKTKVARVLQKINPPFIDGHAHYAKSQGNFQTLPDGGIVMGWGYDPFFTEYAPGETEDREIVFYGYLALGHMMNYRTHKFDGWIGRPLTKPALWTYSKTGEEDSGMIMYFSWNGATEVSRWALYGAAAKNGPYVLLATRDKNGFETIYRHRKMLPWTYAEALDKNGESLGKSAPQETYVPRQELRQYCDDLACQFMPSQEQRDREREQATEQKASQRGGFLAQKKDQILFGSGIGASILLAIIAVVLGTRNRVKSAILRSVDRVWRLIWGKLGEEATGPEYRAVAGDEGDDEEVKAPMFRGDG
ncbi:uncharacterized protein HMPREF1541_08196 [Cyphellophora europaea CBS 101466]|uniref:Arylsulfotransferase N-terminal domain-containing protein n=1 Tax=Cyphellophora europaea (strain CBS 101466) TaxID=1220924 RepID=W2RL30_CYPE1|nr:uncharacterized protein HMPREF1541_08196 [Cyphellophora europaea CBS 101466]ETN37206.1 hypothetical protein HMPREF1541_08196 [Cyphellophora europaea CBS 101466]